MAPSLLQTLLREPSRSYQNIYQEQAGSRPGSPLHSYSSSSRRASTTISIRSSSSNGSCSRTTEATSGKSGPAWSDDHWEWSRFGGRRGLTGGSASLHTPSVVGKSLGLSSSSVSLRSERLRDDDGGSVRSGTSARPESVRTSLSAPASGRRKQSSKGQGRAIDQDGQAGLPRKSRTKSTGSSTSRRYSDYDDLPPVPSSGFGGTSRRYSSVSPNLAPLFDKPDASRSTPPLRQASDHATPSLTSSASSAPSSPPATPVQAATDALLLPAPDSSKSRTASIPVTDVTEPAKQLSSKIQPSADVVQALVGTAHNAKAERPNVQAEPVYGRFYSVDEFFAIAAAPTVASTAVAAPSNEAPPAAPVDSAASVVAVSSEDMPFPPLVRSESDNASFMTADDEVLRSPTSNIHGPLLHPPPSIPRLSLTRTESDQSRLGTKGAVDLDVESEEEQSSEMTEEGEQEVLEPTQAEERPTEKAEEAGGGGSTSAAGTDYGSQGSQDAAGLPNPVERKWSTTRRSSTASSSTPPAPPSSKPIYEIVNSSKPRRSASMPVVLPPAADDRSASPAPSSTSSVASTTASEAASAAVPDWLKRIRVLGEPIQPLIVTQPPPKKPLAPVPHWTVQQLRAKENGPGLAPRPGINRPKSLSSLRSRTSVLEGLPEEEEEEEEAPPVPAMPTWLPKKAQSGASQIASRTTRAQGGAKAIELVHRRAKSADDPGSDRLKLSPLSRTSSLASSIASSTRSASLSLSRTSSSSGMRDVNIDLAELGTPRPKRMSKFFQPPLASTKAVKPPPVIPVVNPPRVPSQSRPASLREALANRDGEEDPRDGDSNFGGSQLSVMSAPQLTPPRPPRNPARSMSLTVSTEAGRPSSRPISRSFSVTDRPSPRPPSISISAAERPSSPPSIATSATERPLPRPPSPVFSAAAPPSRSASITSRSNARPLSSYLPPTIAFDMSALAVSPRMDVGKTTSKRFSLFRSSSSTLNSSRRFEPSIDLLYERMDAASCQKRLKSDEVLVEAIAVGLDRWDTEKTWAIAKASGGAGWVPGRAVYGKVMACGDSVSRLKKGDHVWGLNPLKKSSGLASMVVLHRDNVALAPFQDGLDAEQLAVLPAAAITAMQIMESLCSELPKGSKVLVLNAHQGIGRLCLQLGRYLRPGAAGTRDLWMAAQCPTSLHNGEVVCKEAGASEVFRDEPLAALNSIHEGSFDVVIDTIGGRRLYDASRRILHNSGSFISTVGDSLTSPHSSTATYHTSIRSLRRTFFKKDKKAISYWLANHEVDERDCVRDVLDKVKEAVQAGGLSAKVGRVWSFAEARRAFEEREADSEGVVVKVKQL
ncbi:hypothetical protein JCM21900_006294 [Sporobolomyces salmonicolor]